MAKSKKVEIVGIEGLYQAFLAKLSSSERESIEEKGIAQAMPAFRKFLNSLSDAEMTALVAGEPIVAPEEEEAEEVEE